MNKESNVINKWVDIGVLPIYKKGRKNTYINWDDSIGIAVPFVYGDICGNATILKNVDSKRIAIYVDGYTSEDGYIINKPSFVSALFGNIFKQKIIDSAPYITPYLNNIDDAYKYTKGSHKIIDVKCPNCGHINRMSVVALDAIIKRSGCVCEICSDNISYPNKMMRNILCQLKIDFEPEYIRSWTNSKFYDFYFEYNNKKYIIEMDGSMGHGHEPPKFTKHSKEKDISIDNIKDKLAKEHDIEVVRIDCAYTHVKERFDYIKKHIINSRFSTIFDLSSIDWRECEKFASSSILIDVCNLWDESNYNIKEISKIVHLSHHVVSSYLKVGERIGICTFNDKEKHYRSNKHHGHPVYVYKNDVLIKRFDSIRQCVDKSIETFGVKFDFKCVLNAYNGKRESYKGYIFKRSEEVNNTKLLKGVY